MFDALGFRGIWKRHDVDDAQKVITKLIRAKDHAFTFLKGNFGFDKDLATDPIYRLPAVHVAFLSDTIVVAIESKSEEPFLDRWWDMMVVCRFVSAILRECALQPPALAYRGCVTYGEFTVHENFLVGPAVDDAAQYLNSAQGAFVWLLPQALDRFKSSNIPPILIPCEYGLTPCTVPLKGGSHYETLAISPFDLFGTEKDEQAIQTAILDTFRGSLDVQIKLQNTADFLRDARRDLKEVRESELWAMRLHHRNMCRKDEVAGAVAKKGHGKRN
jgi:hypothetical protein